MLTNFLFAANALSPIFLIILLGWALYQLKIINNNFVDISSNLVMCVTLPLLLILEISKLDIQQRFELIDIVVIYTTYLIIFITSWLFAVTLKIAPTNIGSFVQGSFRSNFGFIGLAICGSLYGQTGIAIAALYLAFLIPLHNFLSITALSGSSNQQTKFSWINFFKKLTLNPLIIAIIIGASFAFFKIKLPQTFIKPADYIASISLPLALLSIGATMQFKNRDYSLRDASLSSAFKIILMPIIGVSIALAFNISGTKLGVLFVLFSVPTAVITAPLAKSMGADGKLASAVVLFSSIGSLVTMAIGLSILNGFFS